MELLPIFDVDDDDDDDVDRGDDDDEIGDDKMIDVVFGQFFFVTKFLLNFFNLVKREKIRNETKRKQTMKEKKVIK